ncbi:MAG: PA1414 family protein [Pseudomonadota bacterium]|nr:PA1414 family protein [Pseudomonadota bacterium]
MKARLYETFWKLAVTLGLIQPPRLQPIPVRARREQERRQSR